jgi:response regulator RpfG family c-di-GMP phosphodiesterase
LSSTPASPPVVAVFNSNDDVVDMLRIVLQQAGFVVVTGHLIEVRDGKLDLPDFMHQHDPQVVVYDIVPPYDVNWAFLNHLRDSEPMKGRRFVLTSTNPAKVVELTKTCEQVHEVVGKPYDLDAIVAAVREALGRQ